MSAPDAKAISAFSKLLIPPPKVIGEEDISERWNPSHGVNSIMMSIISMLSAPNFESPANVEASSLCKNSPEKYKKRI